jgi:hypothetical protein
MRLVVARQGEAHAVPQHSLEVAGRVLVRQSGAHGGEVGQEVGADDHAQDAALVVHRGHGEGEVAGQGDDLATRR